MAEKIDKDKTWSPVDSFGAQYSIPSYSASIRWDFSMPAMRYSGNGECLMAVKEGYENLYTSGCNTF